MATAKDYLYGYMKDSKCSEWMSKVIETFLQKDADNKIDELAKDLLGISSYAVISKDAKKIDVSSKTVTIKELVHKTGVNALAENQKIKFNPQVNIIYGLNGTGKSSYFRILNEMLGGDNDTPIRPNIYIETAKPISVELSYTYGGTDKKINWNGGVRGIEEIKSMRVFDSSYSRNLLRKRNSDELVVKPYGLFIFADLIEYIDKIVARAEEIISDRENKTTKVDTSEMTSDISEIIQTEDYSDENILIIEEILSKTEIDDEFLQGKKNKVDSLREGNPKDKITILNGRVSDAEKAKKHIETITNAINEYLESVKEAIEEFQNAKKESEESKKKLEILQGIPGVDTEIWHSFISSGVAYAKEQSLDEECPFCHQKYSNHAQAIVQAYISFLNDKSQTKLENTEQTIDSNRKLVEKLNVALELDEDKWEVALLQRIKSIISDVNNRKTSLISSIDKKELLVLEKLDTNDLTSQIEKYIKDLKATIDTLSEGAEGRVKAIQLAEQEYYDLKSKFAVKRQQKEIKGCIADQSWVKQAKNILAEVSKQRQKISTLSKKAHNELLTAQLEKEFNDTLKRLGVKSIEIELQGKNNNGVQQTEFTIRKNKDITSILSEGEQKATALALFLSEIALSQNKSTIILDDPVNSLDHRMMQSLADLLMNVENQLIIFTHNKMFLDCFECSDYGHICKGLSSACGKTKGKHIYLYETCSEGKNRKGVIVEKQEQKLDYYLKELKMMLKESPFTKFDEAGIKLRRGVETAIDEVVFNNQVPTKLSNKNSRINWNALKEICNDEILIEGLRQIHGRASGGDLHNGSEREENPLDKEEIEELYNKLKTLCNRT